MNQTKADNIVSIYGLKAHKRLAAVAESNTFITDAVAASKFRDKQERKRVTAVHGRNAILVAEAEDLAIKTACRAALTGTIVVVVLLLYTICSIIKRVNM
jgi:hypothetical protein